MIQFSLSEKRIDPDEVRRTLMDESCGALVLFEGWVRNHNDGRPVNRLTYEAYEPLAVKEGQAVLAEALEQFDITHAVAIHRQGELEMSDAAVIVGVVSAHRDAAFRACRFIIDEIKHRLPIWKKEFYADGSIEWVNCQQAASSLPEDSTQD